MVLGAQLYTVKDFIQTEIDFKRTIDKIANIGYKSVQLSAVDNLDPQFMRNVCDEYGISVDLTHMNVDKILYDTQSIIEANEILGCDYIGLGIMPPKYRNQWWFENFAKDFKLPAQKIADSGKKLMYHNHNIEFEKYDGKTILDHLLDSFTPEEMGVTLDTYWVQAGGADIIDTIEKLKDRIPCVHYKDMTVHGFEQLMAPVMEGNINFEKITKKLLELKCTKYVFVEQDVCQGSPFDCLQQSYNNLKSLNLGF